jgi:hypothetical protein
MKTNDAQLCRREFLARTTGATAAVVVSSLLAHADVKKTPAWLQDFLLS